MSFQAPGPRLGAALVLAVTFASGVFVGTAVERAFLYDRRSPPIPFPDGRGGPGLPARVFAEDAPLPLDLDLTDAQRERIDSILAAERRKAQAALQQIRPGLQARYDSTTAAILDVLTPAQREEFELRTFQRREQIRRRFGPRPPPRFRPM